MLDRLETGRRSHHRILPWWWRQDIQTQTQQKTGQSLTKYGKYLKDTQLATSNSLTLGFTSLLRPVLFKLARTNGRRISMHMVTYAQPNPTKSNYSPPISRNYILSSLQVILHLMWFTHHQDRTLAHLEHHNYPKEHLHKTIYIWHSTSPSLSEQRHPSMDTSI